MIRKKTWVDLLDICLSACCGIHCLVAPLVFAAGTFQLINPSINEKLELVLYSSLLIIGMGAFLPRLIIKRSYGLILSFVIGFILLKISESPPLQAMRIVLLTTGVLFIIYRHYLNITYKNRHAEFIKTTKETTCHGA